MQSIHLLKSLSSKLNLYIKVISIMPITSKTRPTLSISFMWISFVPKTIVFAAVATGNIKPREAANVAGIINNNGATSRSFCKAIITGIANWILAMLEANSLIIVTIIHMLKNYVTILF